MIKISKSNDRAAGALYATQPSICSAGRSVLLRELNFQQSRKSNTFSSGSQHVDYLNWAFCGSSLFPVEWNFEFAGYEVKHGE